MADHNLRIQAHLDTSSIDQQLDRLNQQRGGGGGNDTTGNGISLGMRLRQLQLSLDNLNRTLQSMMREQQRGAQGEGKYGISNDPSLPGPLGRREKLKQAQELKKIGSQAIIDKELNQSQWKSVPVRDAILSRSNSELGKRYRAYKQEGERINRLNEFDRRDRMSLAIGGHFASMIGSSLQDAGYQKAGGAFNVVGGTLGGAASGAIFGPYGAMIGAAVGTITSVASELKKLGDAAEETTKKFQKMTQNAISQSANFRQNEDIKWASDKTQGDWASWDELQRNKVFAEGRADFMRRMLEGTPEEYGLREKLQIYEKELENGEDESRRAGAAIEVAKLIPQIQRVEGWLEQWEGIAKENQKKMDAIDPYSNENHEKFVEEMNRQAEMERENEEKRKQLLMMREQILLGLEQEYAQQGVDVLTGMGKSGKYMSQAEAASTSQERYAPITKKLDTMQKSLDHLSQIDAKLRNLNIGLT